jgi:uncharacterized protein (TIGR02246 family)
LQVVQPGQKTGRLTLTSEMWVAFNRAVSRLARRAGCRAVTELAATVGSPISPPHRSSTMIARRSRAVSLALAVAMMAACGGADSPVAQTASARPSLRATLDAHMAAIDARDLDALLATVTTGERLTLILPGGNVLRTREEYRRLHVEWFAETDWRMQFELMELRELADTGIALLKYRSQNRQADGSYQTRREALLSLVFALEDGKWRLVYDQNTVIPPAGQ